MSLETRKGIVALAFGMPPSVMSNVAIRETAQAAALALDAPIFTQYDCGITTDDSPVGVRHITETPGKPPPTLRICRAAAQWATALCLDEVHVIGAPPHLWRCMRDMKESLGEIGSGIRTYSWAEPELRDSHPPGFWFCAEGTQWYTNRRLNWAIRDIILKCMPWRMYSLIAK